MRIVPHRIYTFEELSEKAKQTVLDQERGFVSRSSDWSEYTLEDFTATVLPCFGWRVAKNDILWSGFWNQGDGLCFAGWWECSKVDPHKLHADCPTEQELHDLMSTFLHYLRSEPHLTSASVKHAGGRYSHELSVAYDYHTQPEEDIGDPKLFQRISSALMRWCYHRLQQEYEYQTSDEAIISSIAANNHEYYYDGRLYTGLE